jgi:hypothetical protein
MKKKLFINMSKRPFQNILILLFSVSASSQAMKHDVASQTSFPSEPSAQFVPVGILKSSVQPGGALKPKKKKVSFQSDSEIFFYDQEGGEEKSPTASIRVVNQDVHLSLQTTALSVTQEKNRDFPCISENSLEGDEAMQKGDSEPSSQKNPQIFASIGTQTTLEESVLQIKRNLNAECFQNLSLARADENEKVEVPERKNLRALFGNSAEKVKQKCFDILSYMLSPEGFQRMKSALSFFFIASSVLYVLSVVS